MTTTVALTTIELAEAIAVSLVAISVSTPVVLRYVKRALKEDRKAIVDAGTGKPTINGWLEALIMALPYPAWVKVVREDAHGAVRFEMMYVNHAYEEWFGIRNSQYAGKTDYDVWPRGIADAYYQHDANTLAQKRSVRIREPIEESLVGVPTEHAGQVLEFEKQYVTKENVEAIIGFVRPDATIVAVPPSPSPS